MQPMAALDFNLAGDEPQEVGLGELMCLLLLLRHPVGNVVMVTDRQSVWDGWTTRVWKRLDSRTTYPAVWREIGSLADELVRIVHVVKVESHCDDDEVREGFTSPVLRALNNMADERAGARAAAIAVPADVVEANRRIQNQAVCILEHAAEAMVEAKLASPPLGRFARERHRVRAPQACAVAGHSCPRGLSGRLLAGRSCCTCHQRFPVTNLVKWFEGHPCPGPPPLPAPSGFRILPAEARVAMGARDIHPSHVPAWHEATQVWACLACGSYSTRRLYKLAKVCLPPTSAGHRTLRLLEDGQVPWTVRH